MEENSNATVYAIRCTLHPKEQHIAYAKKLGVEVQDVSGGVLTLSPALVAWSRGAVSIHTTRGQAAYALLQAAEKPTIWGFACPIGLSEKQLEEVENMLPVDGDVDLVYYRPGVSHPAVISFAEKLGKELTSALPTVLYLGIPYPRCDKCGGSGEYPGRFGGLCYRCKGRGYITPQDAVRNNGYDKHNPGNGWEGMSTSSKIEDDAFFFITKTREACRKHKIDVFPIFI